MDFFTCSTTEKLPVCKIGEDTPDSTHLDECAKKCTMKKGDKPLTPLKEALLVGLWFVLLALMAVAFLFNKRAPGQCTASDCGRWFCAKSAAGTCGVTKWKTRLPLIIVIAGSIAYGVYFNSAMKGPSVESEKKACKDKKHIWCDRYNTCVDTTACDATPGNAWDGDSCTCQKCVGFFCDGKCRPPCPLDRSVRSGCECTCPSDSHVVINDVCQPKITCTQTASVNPDNGVVTATEKLPNSANTCVKICDGKNSTSSAEMTKCNNICKGAKDAQGRLRGHPPGRRMTKTTTQN